MDIEFNSASEYIKYLDEQGGVAWSTTTDGIVDVMEDYAKMYHKRKLKLSRVGNGPLCICGNRLNDKELFYNQCLKCDKIV